MIMVQKYLIVGCGNHGERLLKLLIKKKFEIVVCEKNLQVKNNLEEKYKFFKNITFIDSLSDIKQIMSRDYNSIISNWASERLQTLKFLHDNGCKRIYLEKPFASNLEETSKVEELFSKNFEIIPSLPQNFSPFTVNLNKLINKYKLGNLNYVVHLSGAKGFINNGIHYLDSSINLIDSKLEKVYGEVSRSKINPRKKGAFYYEGDVTFRFKNKKIINMIMSNKSMMNTTSIYNYKFGTVILNEDGNGHLNLVDSKNRSNSITRTTSDKVVELNNFFGDYLNSLEKNLLFFINEQDSQKIKSYFKRSILSQKYLYEAVHELSKIDKNTSLNTT